MHTLFFSCSFSLTFIVIFAIFQTRLSKILSLKKDWINQLKDLNTQAEKSVSCFVFIAGCKCHWLLQLSTHPEDKSERHNTCPNDVCVS